jgi:hypothetical protein
MVVTMKSMDCNAVIQRQPNILEEHTTSIFTEKSKPSKKPGQAGRKLCWPSVSASFLLGLLINLEDGGDMLF